ncbi:MAG: hypothetical protein AAGD14_12085 [Planctomycetota bacterium]
MNRLLATLLFASLIACDKGGSNVPSVTPSNNSNTSKPAKSSMPKAPDAIPQKYVTMLENTWPKVKDLGSKFEGEFKKAQESRGRDLPAVNAASKTFQELADLWAEVAYAAQDESDTVMAKWEKYIASYNKKVKRWTEMSKGLKEFSRVK